ncbi:hypothetical protein JCM24511_00770 [Saitozyma sp. JCM 24511]|nr:hypothetical protein JCM24511_00770 [Saitozyma sp. JCM 24511]
MKRVAHAHSGPRRNRRVGLIGGEHATRRASMNREKAASKKSPMQAPNVAGPVSGIQPGNHRMVVPILKADWVKNGPIIITDVSLLPLEVVEAMAFYINNDPTVLVIRVK